jgi:hypothetical protein
VASPRDKRSVKDPLLMRAWTIGTVEPSGALEQLRECLDEFNQRIAVLREHEVTVQRDQADVASPDNPWLGAALALRCGLMQAEAYRDWLSWSISQLEKVNAAEKSAAPAS